ncbi:GNAT family N-acetyltransferase [Marininema halotolerans]|uniref:GNAT family N-acetyltransferase n=1 Tax=Marininema halotolerans TaxID=1155944 RepID=UPI000B8755F6|nr:GNAT family N-acetyltransferase [Marininema halotolerans]
MIIDDEPQDIGAHFVVGNRAHIHPSYIVPIARAMAIFIFQTEPTTNTLVVEPDSRNRIIIPALEEAGLKVHSRITLPLEPPPPTLRGGGFLETPID